jgi:hydrogenase maturation protein HypF
MALAHLHHAGVELDRWPGAAAVDARARQAVLTMLERGARCPPTSSAGRLFDAVAALVGLGQRQSFDGQAAMQLEALAGCALRRGETATARYPFELCGDEPIRIDAGPCVAEVLADVQRGVDPEAIALGFHVSLAEVVARTCTRIAEREDVQAVALSGGVMVNDVLVSELSWRLAERGLTVLTHARVPPNDGGLSLGQLAVVAARDAGGR